MWSSHAELRHAILQKWATSGSPELCGVTHHEVRPRKRKQTSAHRCSSPSACAAFVGSDFQTRVGGSKRKTFQTGSWPWLRHVTRPRSNRRTSFNQLPLLLTSIDTSPQNGCASITHCLLDVHRLAICTTEELSLQPAWTSPISSSELCQHPAKQFRRTKRGLSTLRQQHFEDPNFILNSPCTSPVEFDCCSLTVTRLEHQLHVPNYTS